MKQEVKTPVLVALAVVALAILGFWLYRTMGSAGNLDQGQVKYTPGVPPWKETDPSKRGPGSGPPPVASPSPSVPGAGQQTQGIAPGGDQHAPPGISAPQISNGK